MNHLESKIVKDVLDSRYYLKNKDSKSIENFESLLKRVAITVAQAELKYLPNKSSRLEKSKVKKSVNRYFNQYLEMMMALRFLPNSPTLMNAGKNRGQLSACYVLPIGDSLESIFDALKNAAFIHQSGGGTGFSFSAIRPKGSHVTSSNGIAAGPISFLKIFDLATDAIKQGGVRRGANMGMLHVDHPDIKEFITIKCRDYGVSNFNLSVAVTDDFMWRLIDGDTAANNLMDIICANAWKCGDPGLVFIDRMNFFNPTPEAGPIEATNPCGEQPLLAWEACNLGSLSLSRYVVNKKIDFKLLQKDIKLAVRFLDNVIDINHYPVKECALVTKANRKVGLGVMGFADLLLKLDIDYDSAEAVSLAEDLMSFIESEARAASALLAKERGPFKNFKKSIWDRLGYPKLRNATLTTVAPTGTISVIAGVSSGCEPVFSGKIIRNVLNGEKFVDWHPLLFKEARAKGVDLDSLKTDDDIRAKVFKAWRAAHEVSVAAHISIQSAFQRHSDSAVSKTINLPTTASQAEVREAFTQAFLSGCKGITVYRDQSKENQVLQKGVFCPSC